MSVLFRHKIT